MRVLLEQHYNVQEDAVIYLIIRKYKEAAAWFMNNVFEQCSIQL